MPWRRLLGRPAPAADPVREVLAAMPPANPRGGGSNGGPGPPKSAGRPKVHAPLAHRPSTAGRSGAVLEAVAETEVPL
eukprot:4678637-Pyramimonas_sp.AAC.1